MRSVYADGVSIHGHCALKNVSRCFLCVWQILQVFVSGDVFAYKYMYHIDVDVHVCSIHTFRCMQIHMYVCIVFLYGCEFCLMAI